MITLALALLTPALVAPALVAPAQLTLDYSKPGVAVSPTLYGLMTEEINYSYDGGLYGELLRNRSLLDDPKRPVHWAPEGVGATIELGRNGPSAARPVALRVVGGVKNDGYWGVPTRPSTTYRLSVWAKSDGPTAVDATLESADGATIYGRTQIKGLSGSWRKFEATLRTAATFTATTDGRLALRTTGGAISLAGASLFGPTHNGRKNGFRPDLMKLLIGMRPTFLRFPGGNYLEGNTPADYFPWKATLGPIEERPGHRSPWGYRSTDGMGLLEFLLWCEDMKAKPLLAVYAGYALNGQVTKAGPELQPFVQDALDEIEYVIGGVDTKWGARRAKDGHPQPFPLEYVEVGNEDGFDRSGSYEGRFVQFYDAIKAKYPKLQVISTTGGRDWLGQRFPIRERRPDAVDEHYYSSVFEMMAMASKYDAYDRKGPKIFVGEWAGQDVPEPWTRPGTKGPTPNMNCALGDAAFMTGLERNSDLVVMACYAPLLVNVNPGGRQWAVNLIGYDGLQSFGSPSYYAQSLFGQHLGNRTVDLALANAPTQTEKNRTIPALFASATVKSATGETFVKLVNPLDQPQTIRFAVRGAKVSPNGQAITLSGDLKAMNSIDEPTKVAPVTTPVSGLGSAFERTVPAHSITVLKFVARK